MIKCKECDNKFHNKEFPRCYDCTKKKNENTKDTSSDDD